MSSHLPHRRSPATTTHALICYCHPPFLVVSNNNLPLSTTSIWLRQSTASTRIHTAQDCSAWSLASQSLIWLLLLQEWRWLVSLWHWAFAASLDNVSSSKANEFYVPSN
jgi:hypothetical protein